MKSIAFLFLACGFSFAAVHRTGRLASETLSLPGHRASAVYSATFSVDTPRAFGPASRLHVRIHQGSDTLLEKTLHLGDPDLFSAIQPLRDGAIEITTRLDSALAHPGAWRLDIVPATDPINVEREPNNTWQQANGIRLGQTIFASADDVPYIPLAPQRPPLNSGIDWFKFEHTGAAPKLVYFWIDLTDRDNIPVDVSVFRVVDGQPVAYTNGSDPVTPPHEVQALPGNKFTTRVITEPGTYYIRAMANHPEYKLRTEVYDLPPYRDPRQAVRTALDYILLAGDSWHANTPRRGGVYDRVSNVHQETSLCVACHPTHFSQRAALYANRNGYPVHRMPQLRFLAERFYNNPRPFYGFEKDGAVWSRMISAPANVLGRMGHLMDVYEKQISHERRESFHTGIRKYLELYYKDRAKLPPDETNGNTPLVSAYEVAWYAWEETRDPKIAALMEQDEIKNNVDLCYQILALAAIDKQKHADHIKRDAERLLSLQRPSGQWSMKFEEKEPEAEFQTGHALWALHAAGYQADHPQIKKALDYLLNRQQQFGGWLDPLQSFENFRTPFRETQMAILALSAYYPGDNKPPAASRSYSRTDTASPDTAVRQQAIESLGIAGEPANLSLLLNALADPSKLVQRTAAWAVRQIYSRHSETAVAPLDAMLVSPNDRVRWGATRIFANHFSALAQRPEFATRLADAASGDPVEPVRMQAIKGLWQFWFWTPDTATKELIEDRLLAGLAQPRHPWIARNLHEAVYNIADENIRYLYNNWVPLLPDAGDRERVIKGRLAIEDRLARKFSKILASGPERQSKELLTALTQFQLRRSDIYDPAADMTAPHPPVYNRIGNDIEQIAFFGESNAVFARALAPLVRSSDPEMKKLAMEAAVLTRDAKFAGPSKVAGDPGEETANLLAVVAEEASPELLKAIGKAGQARVERSASKPSIAPTEAKLDEQYFKSRVRPILEAKGKDGSSCVQCHSIHTLFNGSYATAMNVVDLRNPQNSLLLRKPTSSAETEGIANSKSSAHGGGVRWEVGSPEYNTILSWIRGAKQ